MDKIYFQYTYTIKQNDLNEKDEVTITSILDMFQDSAGKHANLLEVGYDDLKGSNTFWILSKNRVEILDNVTNDEKYIVKTYQSDVGFAGFTRDYYLYDVNNNLKVKADSKWCVLDSKTGKIVSAKNIKASNMIGTPKAFDSKIIRIDKLEEYDDSFKVNVSYNDLDHNHHMNNTKYTVPLINYFRDKDIRFIEIDYVNQSFLDDELLYKIKKVNENEYIINVFNNTKDYITTKCFVRLK